MKILLRYCERYSLFILITLFFLANLVVIDWFPLWRDESFSVLVARNDLSTISSMLSQDVHPPLHTYLLHYWSILFGDSVVSVRMLSVLFGVGALLMVNKIAEFLYPNSRWAAVAATALVASAPFVLYQSIEARAYSLLLFAHTGTVWAILLLNSAQRKKSHSAAFIFFAVLGLYTHVVFIFALLALFIWQCMLVLNSHGEWSRAGLKKVTNQLAANVVLYLVVGALFSPWLVALMQQVSQVNTQGFWLQFNPVEDLINGFRWLFTTNTMDSHLHFWTPISIFILETVGVCLLLLSGLQRTRHHLGSLSFITLAVLYVVSFVIPVYYVRYFSFIVPIVFIAIFDVLYSFGRQFEYRRMAWMLGILLLVCNIYLYFGAIIHNVNLKPDYPSALRYINESYSQATIIHPHGYTMHSFGYYAPQFGLSVGKLYDPEHNLPHFEGLAAIQPHQYYDSSLNLEHDLIVVPFLWEDINFSALLLEKGLQVTETRSFSGGLHIQIWKRQ